MVGIETGEPETEETDMDGEEDLFARRRPMGAINPLLVAQGEGMKCFEVTLTRSLWHAGERAVYKARTKDILVDTSKFILWVPPSLPHLNPPPHTHTHTHTLTHTHQNPIQDMTFPDATDTLLTDKTMKNQTIP